MTYIILPSYSYPPGQSLVGTDSKVAKQLVHDPKPSSTVEDQTPM